MSLYYDARSIKNIKLNHFPRTPNNDRYRWKEMAQWLHETTPTTNSEGATC